MVIESTAADKNFTYMHANICQALADPKRIQILYALAAQPCHVNSLAHDLNLPQSTVSRHLRVLRQQSLVAAQREGVGIIYRLADQRIMQVLDMLHLLMVEAIEKKKAVLNGR